MSTPLSARVAGPGPAFPPGLGNAYLFSAFNALSFQIVVGSPMVLYAKTLGAGATVLGIITGMLPLLVLLQIPAARHVVRVGYRRFVYAGWGTRVAFIFGMAAVPLAGGVLDPVTRLVLLLSLLFGFNFSRGISSAGWLPWITQLVPEAVRGRYLARDALCVQAASCVTLALAAMALGGRPPAWRFAFLFAFSGAMGAVSLSFLKRIPDVEPTADERRSTMPVPWGAIFRHRPFQRFLGLNVGWALAWGGVNVFTVAYLRAEAGWEEGEILLVTALAFVGGLVGLFYFGPRIDRVGSRPVLLVCLSLWVGLMAGWVGLATGLVSARFPVVLLLEGLMGFGYALCNMNLTRLAMQLAPAMGRSHFFALYSVVANLSLGLSPIGWGLFIDVWGGRRLDGLGMVWNRYAAYFAGALLVFVWSVVHCRRLEEPRARRTGDLLREILAEPARLCQRLWPRV